MYLGVDIGGTKTLLGVFTHDGELVESVKFPTDQSYANFLTTLATNLASLRHQDFLACGIAIPGVVDREHGFGIRFGNLDWKNVPILHDIEKRTNCPGVLENDAKAGAIYESNNIIKEFKNVLYVPIGTGIGIAYTANGILDTSLGDRGGNRIILERNGKSNTWEELVAGKAIVRRFGCKASEIQDPKIWKIIANDIAAGLVELLALLDIDAVVFGGGVGAHFEKFEDYLTAALRKYQTPLMPIPELRMAQRPEEAVIYGCYELARRHYGHAAH